MFCSKRLINKKIGSANNNKSIISFRFSLVTQETTNTFRDEMFLSSLEPFTQTSIDFLNQIVDDEEPFTQLTYDSFVALSANRPTDGSQDFEKSIVISKVELRAQIAFDLSCFYLYDKKYDLARAKVLECRENFKLMKKEYEEKQTKTGGTTSPTPASTGLYTFCTFTEEELEGNSMACGVDEKATIGLLDRMNESMIQDYKVRPTHNLSRITIETLIRMSSYRTSSKYSKMTITNWRFR